MAGTGTVVPPLKFSFDRKILAGNADVAVELEAGSSPELLLALAKNDPVPAAQTPIVIGSAGFRLEGGKTLAMKSGSVDVNFSGNTSAKFGIFGQISDLRNGIVDGGDLAESIESSLNFDNGVARPFLLFRWGYDVRGSASGAVALGAAGKLTFSANASRDGLFAMIHQAPATTGTAAALGEFIASIRLPKQIKTAEDLAPATWLITEADGSLGLKAGVTFGYDFSWIRQTSLGTLTGDIGLKLTAGLSASLGFSVSGKYVVLLARESADPAEKKLRLRIFRLRMQEQDFAFRAAATVTPVATILPDKFDDLLRGILGVHANQVMRALSRVDDWTDPNTPIFGPFVNLADTEARKLVGSITGIPADQLAARFTEAKGKIQSLFKAWDDLPANAASHILSLAGNPAILAQVRSALQKLQNLDPIELRDTIAQQLMDPTFRSSPVGFLLEKLTGLSLFQTITTSPVTTVLHDSIGKALGLLDGSTIQNTLTKLRDEINARLHLDQIENAVNSADLTKLDAWLQSHLETFLEQKLVGPAGVAELKKLRAGIAKVRQAIPEIYSRSITALKRNYDFSISATYSKSTTDTALIDIGFDFAAPGSVAAEVLARALDGDFDGVIGDARPGVTVNQGVLTHAIHTDTNVAIALPFFNTKTTHTNDAVASLSVAAQDGGRLYYQAEAKDVVTVRNEHTASLTISMHLLKANRTGALAIHSQDSASYLQSIDRAFPSLTSAELINYGGPFITPLFARDFGTGSFSSWVGEHFGTDATMGKALMSLEVTLPSDACLAWLKAPPDPKHAIYNALSIALQQRFKRLIHDTFFATIRGYRNVGIGSDAHCVLVFCSIPPAVDAKLQLGGLQIAPRDFASAGKMHWDFADVNKRRAMANEAAATLPLFLRLARQRIASAGDPDNVMSFYKDSQVSTIVKSAVDTPVLASLLRVESVICDGVKEAALAIAAFNQNAMTNPAKAREALANFGAQVTKVFNAELSNVAVGDALRPLGALIFLDVVRVLDISNESKLSAMLTITDLKEGVPFPPDGFPNNDPIPADSIVRAETLVHVA